MPILAELNKIGLPIRPPVDVHRKAQPNFSTLIGKMKRFSMEQHFLINNTVYFDERNEQRRCILYFGSTAVVHAV